MRVEMLFVCLVLAIQNMHIVPSSTESSSSKAVRANSNAPEAPLAMITSSMLTL